jgi:phosphatidylserine decarboxylase
MDGTPSTHEPVVQELAALIVANGWQQAFTEAITAAAAYNVPGLGHIQSLDGYLAWLDALLRWLPAVEEDGGQVRDKMCEFYFILDQPSVRALQDAERPHGLQQPLTALSAWLVAFARAWGRFMDSPQSMTPESLKSFYASPIYHMDEYMPAPSGWLTFNQFFARHVKPGMRPVAALGDDRVIVSPADSTFTGTWEIRADAQITAKQLQWSIGELLDGSPYTERFVGGLFTHSYLNTYDYHRLHTPVRGRVLESRVILGQAYFNVKATPVDQPGQTHALHPERSLVGTASTGYQFSQARGLLVLDSPIGLVAVLPIGMAQVSSVVMTAEVGRTLRKGEEFAYFQFGGSDHIVLFEPAVQPALTADVNTHYRQGTCIGYANP